MKVFNSARKSCWVQTKWGRYEANLIMEMQALDDEGTEKTFVAVEFKDPRFSKLKSEEKIFEKKDIDYIKEE